MSASPSDVEVLEQARQGDLARLAKDPASLLQSVQRLAAAGEASAVLELVGRTWRAWFLDRELHAGRRAAAIALETPGGEHVVPWRCRVLYADGLFAFRLGDRQGSQARNAQALAIARATNDARGECEALTGLARVALRDGDYAEVVALAGKGREIARASGDESLEAAPLHLHAAGVRLMGDYPEARRLYEESRGLAARLCAPERVSMEEHNLGWVCLHLGEADAAQAHFERVAEPAGDDSYGVAWQALNRAGVAWIRGRLAEARQAHALGAEALKSLHMTLDPDDQSELDWLESVLGLRS